MNYYYWGQFIVASLIHMSGITTEVAYNLAIPTLFAFTAGAAFTIGSNLVGRTSLNLSSRTKIIPFAAGMSGLIFVCVIGNLDGFFQSFGILSDKIFNGNIRIMCTLFNIEIMGMGRDEKWSFLGC